METQTALPAVIGAKVRVYYANAGGTAEGLPFVPVLWDEGRFLLPEFNHKLHLKG